MAEEVGNRLKNLEDRFELPLIKGEDLLSKPLTRPVFVVDPIVPGEGITMLYGPPKVGKSTMLWTMGDAIETGGQFLELPTTQYKCIYMNFDLPEFDLQARWKKGGYSGSKMDFWNLFPAALDITQLRTQHPRVFDKIQEVTAPYHVVMIDCLYRIMLGRKLTDDEVPGLATEQLSNLFPHKSVILLHHARKQTIGQHGPVPPSSEDFLGSQLWFAAVQSQLQIYRKNADMSHFRSNGQHVGVWDDGLDIFVDDTGCEVTLYNVHKQAREYQELSKAEVQLSGADPNYIGYPTGKRKELIANVLRSAGHKIALDPQSAVRTIDRWIKRSGYRLI